MISACRDGGAPALPPVASAGEDAVVNSDTQATLNGSATDPENGALSYAWLQTGGEPKVALSSSAVATPTFAVPPVTENTTLTFQLTVRDTTFLSDTDDVAITVNAPPVAVTGDDQTVRAGVLVTLADLGSSDPGGGELSYRWSQTGGAPLVGIDNSTTTVATFTAPVVPRNTVLGFRLTVTDEHGLERTDEVFVTVLNTQSTADVGVNQSVVRGDVVTIVGSNGHDAGNGALTYSWTQTAGPPVTLVGADTALLRINTNGIADAATLTFQLTVTDEDGLSVVTSSSVTVSESDEARDASDQNAMPIAAARIAQSAHPGEQLTLDGSQSNDPDEGQLTFEWTQVSGPSVTLDAATTAAAAFTVPTLAEDATLEFQLTVAEEGGLNSQVTLPVYVNAPPTADAGADQSASPGVQLTLAGFGSDPGGGTIGYWWWQAGGEPVAPVGDTTGADLVLTVPQMVEDAILTFTLAVTDEGGLTVTDEALVIVNASPPLAAAMADAVVEPGAEVTLDGTGSMDPGGAIASYSWSPSEAAPGLSLSDAAAAAPTFTAPAVTTDTHLVFELTVIDDHGAAGIAPVAVLVNAAPPRADAGRRRSAMPGDEVVLDGSASIDVGGEIVAYQWRQTAGDEVTLSATDVAAPTFTVPAAVEFRPPGGASAAPPAFGATNGLAADTTLAFELTVTDVGGLSSTAEVEVFVNLSAPQADAGTLRKTMPGDEVTLDGSASTDIGGGIAAYEWRQTGGIPTVALSDASAATPTFTAPDVTGDATLTFELTVTDADGAFSTAEVEVFVNASLPRADAGQPQNVAPGAAVTLDGSGSSDTGGIETHAWQQTGGTPTVTLSDASAASPTFAAPNTAEDLTLTFELTVTDAGGEIDAAQVMVFVNASAPRADAGPHQNARPGAAVLLDGSTSTDPGGEITIYAWRQTGGTPVVALSDASAASPTFTAPDTMEDLTLTFELTVTDAGDLPSTAEATVFVNASAPQAVAGQLQSVVSGTSVVLDGSGSTDPGGAIATRAWRQTGGTPVVTLSSASAASPTFVAPNTAEDITLTFELTVTDAGGLSSTAEVMVVVNIQPPQADAGQWQVVVSGAGVMLDGSASTDPGGAIATYVWQQTGGTPLVTLSNAAAVAPTFIAPAVNTDTALTFDLTVTDAGGESSTATVEVFVNASAPRADAGRRQNVRPNTAVVLSGSASTDPGGAIATHAWRQTGGTSVPLSDTSIASPGFSTPAATADVTLTFELTVTDAYGESSSAQVEVFVNVAAPVANAGSRQNAISGASVVLDGSGSSDAGGAITAHTWRQVGGTPTVSLSDPSAEAPTFTAPTVARDVTLTFELTVTDAGGESSTARVEVFVNASAPRADAGGRQNVRPGTSVVLDGSGSTDPGGAITARAWQQTGGTTVVLSDASAEAPTFTAPATTTDLTLTFRLTVTDTGTASSTAEATVFVNVSAPQADAGRRQSVRPGATVTLDGSGSSDVGGAITAHAWRQAGGTPTVTLSSETAAAPTFTAPAVTTDVALVFELTVTDAGGESATATVEVFVNVSAPEASAGQRQNVRPGATVTLDGSGSSDAGGAITSHAWQQTGGAPTVSLSSETAEAPTFTAPNVASDTTLIFMLTVADVGVETATATVEVFVNVSLPRADAGQRQTVRPGATVTLDGSGSSDVGGSVATYAWQQTGGTPSVTLSDASAATPTFTAPNATEDVTLTFELTVTDAGDETATATVEVFVKASGPLANAGLRQRVRPGETVTLDGTASTGIGSDITTHAWQQTGGAPPVTLSDASAQAPTFTAPDVTADVTLTFELTVTDAAGEFDAATVEVFVNASVPQADAGERRSVRPNGAVALDGSGSSDPGGAIAAYAWQQTGGAAAVTLSNPSVAAPTFAAPAVTEDVALTFELTVTDAGGLSATATVEVFVNVSAPQADAGERVNVRPNGAVVLDGSGSTDPGGAITAHAWRQTGGTPMVSLSNPSVAAPTFAAPNVTEDVALTFELEVTDTGDETATASVVVLVNVSAPRADAGTRVDVISGTEGTLDGSGSSDPGGAIATYAWSQPVPQDVALSATDVAMPTFAAPAVTADTTLTFTLTVADAGGETSMDTVTVFVNASAPVADAGTPQTATSGAPRVVLDGTGSSDAGGGITAYAWSQQAPQDVLLSATDAATVTFTAPTVTEDVTLTFTLTVTDAAGLTDVDTVTITVNALPVAAAGEDRTVNAGSTATLDGSGSRAAGGRTLASHSWTQQSPASPTPVLAGGNTATATFTAPTLAANAVFVFRLTVTDTAGLAHADEVSITVNAPPQASAGDDQAVGTGDTVTMNGSGSDPGGGAVTYSWTQTGGAPMVTLSSDTARRPTFTVPTVADTGAIRAETLTFTFTVTDANGLTAQDAVDIHVIGSTETIAAEGHGDAVRGISVSRDGRLAVSGGLDGTVRLWNASTGAAIHTLGEHDGAVYAVAISADGTRAISGGLDGTVRLWAWDETGGAEVRYGGGTRSLGNKGIWVYAVALNEDGSRAASGGFDGKVRVWNTATTGLGAGEEVTYAVAGGEEGETRGLGNHGAHSVYGVALSDDGGLVLSGGADGTVRLWNASDGSEVHSLADDNDGPMGTVFGVALSGDGTIAVAGTADNNVHVWNATAGVERLELAGHTADVSGVSLNAAKTRVLSVGGDGTTRLWNVDAGDIANGTQVHAVRQHTDYAWSAALSGLGDLALSSSSDGVVSIWNTATQAADTTEAFATVESDRDPATTGDVRTRELGYVGTIHGVSLSADGRFALAGSSGHGVRLWDAITGEFLRDMTGHTSVVRDVSLSADGRLALSGGNEGTVRLWDATTGGHLRTMLHGGNIYGVSLNADGRLALSGSYSQTVRLWDATTGGLLHTMAGHTSTVWDVSLNADGRLALSGSHDGARLWDATTGGHLRTMVHGGHVNGVSLNADGRLALSGGYDQTVQFWDASAGELLHTIRDHTNSVQAVSLDADGRLALSGGYDQTVRLWNATTGEHLRTMTGHGSTVQAVSLSADGRLALSGGSGTSRLWRLGRSDNAFVPSSAEADAGEDRSVASASEATLNGSGSTDPRAANGKPIAYHWWQTVPPDSTLSAIDIAALTVTLSGHDTEMATFTAPSVTSDATLRFALTVTDARGLVATDEVTVTVNPLVTAGAGDDRTVAGEATVTLVGSGSALDGGAVTYSWAQTGGTPMVSLENPGTRDLIFTAPAVTRDTTLTFVLTVTDGDSLTATDEVTVTVNPLVTAEAGDDQSAASGTTVTLAGSGSALDGGALTYSWSQTAGTPMVSLSNGAVSDPTFIVPTVTTTGAIRAATLTFTLTVQDTNGKTAQDTVAVHVVGDELLTVEDHEGAVRGVSISRDGRLAVSGGLDGTVRLWNASTGAAIHTLGRHDGAVYAVAINADGTHAISGGVDGTVRLWTWSGASGGEVLYDDGSGGTRSLGNKGIWVYAVALNKDGSRAASGGFDGKVRTWNTAQTGDGAGTEITYDNPDTLEVETRILGDHGSTSVYGVSLSDDGGLVLSGGAGGTVRLWNVGDGTEVRSLTDDDGPMGVVFGVSLSGDGRIAVAGSADNNVHVWNADTGDETHELSGHLADVSGVSLNTAGTRLLSVGGDGTVRLWNVDASDAANGTEIHALRQHTDYAWSAALSGIGDVALSGSSDGKIHLWNTGTQPADTTEPFTTTERDRNPATMGDLHFRDITGHTSDINSVSLSADGRFALSGSGQHGRYSTVRLWDATTATHLRTMTGHTNDVRAVSLSADGRIAVSGSSDNTVRLWDTATGAHLRTMTLNALDVSLSADGRLVLSGSSGSTDTVRLWDATTGENLRTMDHVGHINNVSLSADGRIAISGEGRTALLWDTTTGELQHTMGHGSHSVYDVSLSADGRIAVSGSGYHYRGDWDTTMRFWDVATGTLLHSLPQRIRVAGSFSGSSMVVSLSADGRLALWSRAYYDGFYAYTRWYHTIWLLDATTGEYLRTITGNASDGASAASLSADGRLALSVGNGNTLRLWRFGRSDDTFVPSSAEADAGADHSVASASEATLDGSGSTDTRAENGKPIAYYWRQTAPAGTTLSAADLVTLSANNTETATFTAPSVTADTTLEFALTVTDTRGLVATDEVTVTVNPLVTAGAGEDQTVAGEAAVTLSGSGSALDGEVVTYSWAQTGGTPTVSLDNPGARDLVFTAPAVTEDTILTFVLTVTAGGGPTAIDEVMVTVNPLVTAEAGDNQFATSGATVTLSGSGQALDGGTLTYSWSQTAGTPSVTLVGDDTQEPTFTVPPPPITTTGGIRVATLTFTLTVSDVNGKTAQDTVAVYLLGDELITVRNHEGAVRGVSISRDGRRAVSGGLDGTVRLWNANTGAAIRTLGRHDGAVVAVAINAGGTHAISGGLDGTVRLWTWTETGGGEVLYGDGGTRSLGQKGIWVYAVALSEDGSRAASGGFDGKVRVWNTATTGANAGGEILYDNPDTPATETNSLGNHGQNSVYGVSLSDDGGLVLSGGADGTVRLWNAGDGTEVRSLTDDDGPMGAVFGVFLSGDGTVAAAGSADNNVHVWNAATGDETHELTGHTADVSSVALNAAKTRLLSAGGDGTVRLWNVDADDAADGTAIRTLRQHTDYVWSTALNDIGDVALSGGSDGVVHIWNTTAQPADTTATFATIERDRNPDNTGDVRSSRLTGHASAVTDVSLSANGRFALSGSGFPEDHVRIWDAATGASLRTITGHTGRISSVSLSADGRLALSGSSDTTVRVWDATTGTIVHSIDGHTSGVTSVSLSGDGRLALSGGGARTARLWNAATGGHLRTWFAHTGSVGGVSLSANGRLALSGGDDNTVYLWDATTGTRLSTMTGHPSAVEGVSLSADGRVALSAGGSDRMVRVWDATAGTGLHAMRGHADSVESVSLSADGRLALSGSNDDTVRLWNAATGEHLRTMTGHAGDVNGVSLSADGRLALSGSSGTVRARLWRLGRSDDTAVLSTADADAGADETVASASTVMLDGSGSSDSRTANDKPVAYYWRQTAPMGTTLSAADTVTLPANDTETVTFTAPTVTSNTTLQFALIVTDALGVVDTDEVTITVTASSGSAPQSLTGAAPRVGSTAALDEQAQSPTEVAPHPIPAATAAAPDAPSPASPTCASSADGTEHALRGWMRGAHCVYPASLLGTDNPLETDIVIPALPNGGAHVFQGSLVVGHARDMEANPAAVATDDGPTLTVEPGAVLAFEGASSSLVVNPGARLLAVGGADKPIALTSSGDVDGDPTSPGEVPRWGGIEINGSDTTGGTSSRDGHGSGRLEYVVVKHVAANDGTGAVTLRGVGRDAVIQNLQVYDVVGNGLALVGGAVSIENFVAVYVRGDAIDIGAGWAGTLANALVIQPERGGNHCLNASGGTHAASMQAGDAQGAQNHPATVRGLTCITSPRATADGNQGLGAGIRLGANPAPVIERSLVVGTFADDADARANYCLRIDTLTPQAESDERPAPSTPTPLAPTLLGNVFACEDKTDGASMPDGTSVQAYVSSGNNQFADVLAPTDPTAATDTELQLLGGTPPVYSLDYSELRVNGADASVTSPDATDFPGAASQSTAPNWLRPDGIDWTYGIFEGSRAKPLWFEATR